MTENNTKIPCSGRIDVHNLRHIFPAAVERLKSDNTISVRNKELILKFLRDAEIGKTIKKGQKKKIGAGRLYSYVKLLSRFAMWIEKDFDKVKQEDMERVILALENDECRTDKGKFYSDNTKVLFKQIVKKFYKWLMGNNDHYPDLVTWIDTSLKEKEILALTKDEIEKMVAHSSSLLQKTAIMVLFDSGARIEEFLNIRLKHLTRKDDYYVVMIEYSKTKPRPISLPLCTKLLDELLKERNLDSPEEQLFPFSYVAIRMMLYRLGRKVLKKPVYPHLLRHSSATYYADIEGNYFRFCKRYGWTYGSKMAQRYIDRAKINIEKTANAVKIDEISKVKKDNQILRESLRNVKSELDELLDWKERMSRIKVYTTTQTTAKAMGKLGTVKSFLEATT